MGEDTIVRFRKPDSVRDGLTELLREGAQRLLKQAVQAEEKFLAARAQRCWVHKSGNALNYLPRSLQGKAKGMLHEIWMAPTRSRARAGFDQFLEA